MMAAPRFRWLLHPLLYGQKAAVAAREQRMGGDDCLMSKEKPQPGDGWGRRLS